MLLNRCAPEKHYKNPDSDGLAKNSLTHRTGGDAGSKGRTVTEWKQHREQTHLAELVQAPKQSLFFTAFLQCIITEVSKLFLQWAYNVKPKVFQALWAIESLLQLLTSAGVTQNSHRQRINDYTGLCFQNISLYKLARDDIWPANRSLTYM